MGSRRVGQRSPRRPGLDGCKNLREVLRTAIRAIAIGRRVPKATLEAINRQLACSPVQSELVENARGGIRKRFRPRWQETGDLLAPWVESAADLLTGADHSLIHQCAGVSCTLLFYDRTKNHRQHCCSVVVCGNRAKVAACRARQSKAT